jgi:hypothetical protein
MPMAISSPSLGTLMLVPDKATVRDMGRGTCTARIYDYHQGISLAAIKEEACKG